MLRFLSYLNQLLETPSEKALRNARKIKYLKLDIYQWLLRIPDGSYQTSKYRWVHVTRKTNHIELQVTTHEEKNDRSISRMVILDMDDKGLVSCYHQIRDMWPTYHRGDLYEVANKKYEDETELTLNFALESLRFAANDFYDNPMIDFKGVIIG
jgi:hypothetical protein